jgi:hypothetical protein
MAAYINPDPSVDAPEDKKKQEVELDENDYTPRESVYFAFIDVLGFRKAFDDNRLKNNGAKDDEFAKKYKDVFKYYFSLMNSANFANTEKPLCYAGQTSDSLYFYTEKEVILIEFIKIFTHFNAYAMAQDVFFRGGIAKGNLFCKKDYQFYGESVIYAYLLENEISKNPIIMIDENTYNAMSISPDREDLIEEKNGRYNLRPFAYLKHKFQLDLDELSINLREVDRNKIRETIASNKSKFEYDARNYEKYVFLLRELDVYLGI